MSKKGLGAGLGALFDEASLNNTARDFEYLPLHRLEPMKDQPRTRFDQDSLDSLADSIREHGVFSPLMVRGVGDGYYQIIAGERRWRAAKEAGLKEVPARIVVADDQRAIEIAMVENLQREDLSPIEEALGYKRLMEQFSLTQDEVAQRVSKSRPSVANSLRLLSLPDEVMAMVYKEELSAGSARALLALKDDADIKAAAATAAGSGMSVREVESFVRKFGRSKTSPTKQRSIEVNYLAEAQKKLTTSLGRRVSIKPGKGKGKIELEYYDGDDFDVLFDALISLGDEGLEND